MSKFGFDALPDTCSNEILKQGDTLKSAKTQGFGMR